jgi:alkanesulfonate monooxygenase SsuD/methylene tetrahydromethanopterin reductase-like flavin-dependent oxidoreductase (luciferase family)
MAARHVRQQLAERLLPRSNVRFSYAESMTSPSFYAPLALAAQDSGYDSIVVPDGICYPERSTSVYPFNPDGTRDFLEDKPFLEPFSLIPALGAVTERIRFVTFVLKLPVRNPVLVAKPATRPVGGRLLLPPRRHLRRAPVKIAPGPAEPVPILIDGHSDAALRRAARAGDGCTGAAIPTISPACSPGWRSSAARRAPRAVRSTFT